MPGEWWDVGTSIRNRSTHGAPAASANDPGNAHPPLDSSTTIQAGREGMETEASATAQVLLVLLPLVARIPEMPIPLA
jgi:hypothetical protein